jgi:hypothetical protein
MERKYPTTAHVAVRTKETTRTKGDDPISAKKTNVAKVASICDCKNMPLQTFSGICRQFERVNINARLSALCAVSLWLWQA